MGACRIPCACGWGRNLLLKRVARCAIAASIVCAAAAQPYRWDLPVGFPKPAVPADNPMSEAKVRLGRYLFYDKRLSVNGAQSCANCHQQSLAFTDGRSTARGATG